MNNQKIKCVVWDLDNTVWDGVLIEDQSVTLKPHIKDIMTKLDERGILQSVCSRNDFSHAMDKLIEFELDQYFIYPQIGWGSKAEAIGRIIKDINIGFDTVAFIDDQVFEREEVNYKYPEILCLDVDVLDSLLDMEEFIPKFITEDSKKRRKLYKYDILRNKAEESFSGSDEEFLSSLQLKLSIKKAEEEDLKRAEELTVRTHQLNATGYTYSYDELAELIKSKKHEVLIVQLDDKYGEYGKIGLILIEKEEGLWKLQLLLMSCRVMSRGIGAVLINYLMNRAKEENVALHGYYVPNDRNRLMYITYKFAGFKEVHNDENLITLEADLSTVKSIPSYIDMVS